MSAVDTVVDAWMNPGPVPPFHYAAKAALRRRWPALTEALDALARERGRL